MRLGFIGPALGRPSGGSTYNAEVLVHWPASLPRPASVELAGAWPEPDAAALSALRAALGRFDAAIVDGLVGAAQPEILAEATASGRRVLLLIHLPLADEGGLDEADRARLEALECASVRAAWRVVATSRRAAADVARRHGRPDAVAVAPGVNPAPVAPPHSPPHLLSIGAIGPLKNQLAVASALTACADLVWRASLVGPVADPAYADAVAAALHTIPTHGVSNAGPHGVPAEPRVRLTGPRTGAVLDATWASGDLLLHPSRVETYGLVVTEALARGIPAIVGRGTGAEEALESARGGPLPGAAVGPEDHAALTALLRRWLTDPALRRAWRAAALDARPRLRPWDAAASDLARCLAD